MSPVQWCQSRHLDGQGSVGLGGGAPGDKDDEAEKKSGRPQWESTSSLKGLRLLTEITVQDEKVVQIAAGSLSQESKGVCLMLIGTWQQLTCKSWIGPLLLLVRGSCERVLDKLGAVQERVKVTEVLLRPPEGGQAFSKKVTAYSLSPHEHQLENTIESIAWSAQGSAEAILESDERWSHELGTQSVRQDWVQAAKRMLAAMTSAGISELPFHGAREPRQEGPPVWSIRSRMNQELSEKALSSSGRESLFIRPSIVMGDTQASHAIVWAARHDDGTPELPLYRQWPTRWWATEDWHIVCWELDSGVLRTG